MSDALDDRTIVLAHLQQHGISPTPEEIDGMVAAYATTRAGINALYSVPGVRYESPAITFDPRLGSS